MTGFAEDPPQRIGLDLPSTEIAGSVPVEPPSEAGGRMTAAGALGRIRAFVNTIDLEGGVDELDDPAALRAWLAANDLPGADARVTRDDLSRALAVREALRELLAGNAGHGIDPLAIARLNAIAAAAPLAVRFAPDGRAALAPQGGGVDAALGRLLADVVASDLEGLWARLKVCRNEACRWAFYDGSKNRSGAWCSMAVCGNRMKVRRHRRRMTAATHEARDPNMQLHGVR
jgi:predicted RNA-binding Zn ribbon-like protein